MQTSEVENKNQTPKSLDDFPSMSKLPAEVEKYHFWENPTFLFVCMGLLTMSAMLGTYFIAQRYDDPIIVIASVSLVAGITTLVGGMTIKTIDQLAAANRMKTEFVSIASHQLRTPLSIIKWYVEFLSKKEKQKGLNAEQIKYIHTIGESNQRMIRLVNDLLDISRIETGKIQIHPEPTNLVELCQNIIQENKPLADRKKIKISFKYEQSIPLLNVDPKRISLVINNLLGNAIKYTKAEDKGYISVELSEQGNKFMFTISDNGVGIPEKDQRHIFKKFFRANNTMKLKTSGTGLGLFIAKAIVESHRGKLWFVSKEGEGTTFYFNLPIKKEIRLGVG
jgi:signal transduction histidine kinase